MQYFFYFDSLTLPQKCMEPPWGGLPPTLRRVWIFSTFYITSDAQIDSSNVKVLTAKYFRTRNGGDMM